VPDRHGYKHKVIMHSERTVVFMNREMEYFRGIGDDGANYVERHLKAIGTIEKVALVDITEDMLHIVFSSEPLFVWNAIVERFAGARLRTIVLSGHSIVENVRSLIGTDNDPSVCPHGSLRYYLYAEVASKRHDNFDRYLRCMPIMLDDGAYFYHNFLTTVKTEKEALDLIELIDRH
jgi:nucleoside diphosphate kinase